MKEKKECLKINLILNRRKRNKKPNSKRRKRNKNGNKKET